MLSAEFKAARDAFNSIAPGDFPKAQAALAALLPPCPSCEYWKPDVTVHVGTKVTVGSGISVCEAKHMHRDFSCFEPSKRTQSGIQSSDA